MGGRHRWMLRMLMAGGLVLAACGEQQLGAGPNPSAKERQGRSEVLRGLVASKENLDPNGMPAPGGGRTPPAPEGEGIGGSGRPAPTGSLHGRVAWVGDDELLVRDASGVERDLYIPDGTRLISHTSGEPLALHEVREGDEVHASYDSGPGGWSAHEVEVMPATGRSRYDLKSLPDVPPSSTPAPE